jgi:hypothetical protein
MFFPGILVPSLGGVSKEGSVAHVARSNAENTIWGKVVASPESGPW